MTRLRIVSALSTRSIAPVTTVLFRLKAEATKSEQGSCVGRAKFTPVVRRLAARLESVNEATRCVDGHSVPIRCGVEPRVRRLAPVAGPKRDGISAERGLLKDVAGGRAAGGLARDRRRRRAIRRSAAAHGRLYTLGARSGTEYVMAFDAATGKKTLGDRAWPAIRQRPGGRPARHADRRRRPALHLRRERRSVRGRCRDRQGDLEGQRAREVRRIEHPVGSERVAARPERSHPRQCRGRGAAIVALNEDRRLGHLAEPGRRAGIFLGGAPRGRRHSRGNLLHAPSGRSASTSTTGKLLWSYDQVANRTANIATPIVRGNCVFLSSDVRHRRRAAGADAAGGTASRARGLLHARDAESPRQLGAHRRLSLRLLRRHPDGDEVRHRPGRLAGSQRRQGLARLCRRPALPLQREGRGRAGRSQSQQATASTAAFRSRPAACPTWSHPVVSNGKLYLRDQDTIYAYDVRARVEALIRAHTVVSRAALVSKARGR